MEKARIIIRHRGGKHSLTVHMSINKANTFLQKRMKKGGISIWEEDTGQRVLIPTSSVECVTIREPEGDE